VVQVELPGGAQLGEDQLVQPVQTLASVQNCRRRQQVVPEQPNSVRGSWFQLIPVYRSACAADASEPRAPRRSTMPTAIAGECRTCQGPKDAAGRLPGGATGS